MRFGSVCSGIEAASVAWQPLGWKAQWLSEIEPFPCALLAHHYPNTPNLGDMTKFESWPTDDQHAIDLLCGGTPCQSFSVAGLRKGLDDPRGNLMLTFGAIAAKYRPQWLVWENVPGVLSSNGGRDFGAFLGLLGILGYGFAYRVLDAQYFGVAQRRRRVFVVGCLGDWRRAAAVLFERHSLSGHPAPRRQAGKVAPGGAASGAASSRWPAEVSSTLDTTFGTKQGLEDQHVNAGCPLFVPATHATPAIGNIVESDVASCLTKNSGGGDETQNAAFVAQVTHSLRGEGFDASEDGTGRGTPLVPVGVTIHGTDPTVQKVASYSDVAQCLRARTPGNIDNSSTTVVQQPIPFDTTQITSKANYSNPKEGDPCHPLAAGAHVPAIAFPANLSGTQCAATENLAPSMGALNPTAVAYSTKLHNTTSNQAGKFYEEYCTSLDRSRPPPAVFQPTACEVADTLSVGSNQTTGFQSDIASFGMQVRRLTPRECERLQGFSDNYTLIPITKRQPIKGQPAVVKMAADGPRYKALGNSWAVPNVRWIGERIAAVAAIKEVA